MTHGHGSAHVTHVRHRLGFPDLQRRANGLDREVENRICIRLKASEGEGWMAPVNNRAGLKYVSNTGNWGSRLEMIPPLSQTAASVWDPVQRFHTLNLVFLPGTMTDRAS